MYGLARCLTVGQEFPNHVTVSHHYPNYEPTLQFSIEVVREDNIRYYLLTFHVLFFPIKTFFPSNLRRRQTL
jgi:hypothetical protein